MIEISIQKKDPKQMAQDFLSRFGDLDLKSVDEQSLADLQKISKIVKEEMNKPNPSPMILSQMAMKGNMLIDKCCASEGEGEAPETGQEMPESMPMEHMGGNQMGGSPMSMLQEIKAMLEDLAKKVS